MLGVYYVSGAGDVYRIIDQRVFNNDLTVRMRGDVTVANHPFTLTRGPRSVTTPHLRALVLQLSDD